jgi:hypothetical protein
MSGGFFWGAVAGVAGTWAFHKWIKPIGGKG